MAVSWNPFRPLIGYRCKAISLAGSLGNEIRAVPQKGYGQKRPDSLAFLTVGDTSFFLNERAYIFIGNKSGCELRIFDESIARKHALIEHVSGEAATETSGLDKGEPGFTICAWSYGRSVIIKSLSKEEPIVLNTETPPYKLKNGDRIFLETTNHDPKDGDIELIELKFMMLQRKINGDLPQPLSVCKPSGLLPPPVEVLERQVMVDLQAGGRRRTRALKDLLDQNTSQSWRLLIRDESFVKSLLIQKNQPKLMWLIALAHDGDQVLVLAVRRLFASGQIDLKGLHDQCLLPPLLQLLETSVLVELYFGEFPVSEFVESIKDVLLREIIHRAEKKDYVASDFLFSKWIGRNIWKNISMWDEKDINRLYVFGVLPALLEVLPLEVLPLEHLNLRRELMPEVKQLIDRVSLRRLEEVIDRGDGIIWLRQHCFRDRIRELLGKLNVERFEKLSPYFIDNLWELKTKSFPPALLNVVQRKLLLLAVEGDVEAEKAIAGQLMYWEREKALDLFDRGILEKILNHMGICSHIEYAKKLFEARKIGQDPRLDDLLEVVVTNLREWTENRDWSSSSHDDKKKAFNGLYGLTRFYDGIYKGSGLPYRAVNISLEYFESVHTVIERDHKELFNFLTRRGITKRTSRSQLADVFNYLIGLPDFIEIIDNDREIPEDQNGRADRDVIIKNKQKLEKIYWRTLSKCKFNFDCFWNNPLYQAYRKTFGAYSFSDLTMEKFKETYNNIKETRRGLFNFLTRRGIVNSVTGEQLSDALNYLINLPDFIEIIDSDREIPENEKKWPDDDIRARNKQKLEEIFPSLFRKSETK